MSSTNSSAYSEICSEAGPGENSLTHQ